MLNRGKVRRARRMIRSSGYLNMRLVQGQLVMEDIRRSYTTSASEAGGTANMDAFVHEMYMQEMRRINKKNQWYAGKIKEHRHGTDV